MKCFIIAALTADGYIGRHAGHAAMWTGKADKKRFVELTKRAGTVVMGLNTWNTLKGPLKDRTNIVYSNDPIEGVETTTASPAELLQILGARGVNEVAICGGSSIYTMFMAANVVDTLYLTIEPLLFGNGMRLFTEELKHPLILVSQAVADNGAILLEYKVDYSGIPRAETRPIDLPANQ